MPWSGFAESVSIMTGSMRWLRIASRTAARSRCNSWKLLDTITLKTPSTMRASLLARYEHCGALAPRRPSPMRTADYASRPGHQARHAA